VVHQPVPGVEIVSITVYRGPNYWSYNPAINLLVDFGLLEEWPTDRLPGFAEQLVELVPELCTHDCSRRHLGGFLERLEEGTWLGHVAEHVALALQTRAGFHVRRGKTRPVGAPGRYYVIYSYDNEDVGLAAGKLAVRLVNHLEPPAGRGRPRTAFGGRANGRRCHRGSGADRLPGPKVVIDYGHNAAAMRAPVRVLPRRIAVVGTAGDRSDKELRELGWVVACHFNEVMIREDDNLRGRSPGQLAALVAEGVQTAIDCGASCQFVEPVLDEVAAVKAAMARAEPGDVVVLCVEDAARAWQYVP
jgi:Cyanophycin synthase-like N-terminal domain/Mur ligase, glutamate ligase domain